MRERAVFAMLALSAAWFSAGDVGWAEETNQKDRSQLAEMLERTKVTLAQGFQASESQGKPISGKFEVENEKLQLSVYTMKDGKFSEVVVDHKTGKVEKVEAITGGDDLAATQTQSEAMAKAKLSLQAATDKAIKANKGFAAISAMPSLEDGHPVAKIGLINDEGEKSKTIPVKLD